MAKDKIAISEDEAVARTLAALFALNPGDTLKRLNMEDMLLGRFVRTYAELPEAVDLDQRSSIREDAVVQEIARLLGDYNGKIRVIDACCGLCALPRRIMSAVEAQVSRIEYLAIERDSTCVDIIRSQQDDYGAFASFSVILRDIGDLNGGDIAEAHLVVLNNVLHEIPPRHWARIFAKLNSSLLDGGCISIIDMESLPPGAPEAIAITWTAEEVKHILNSGGLKCEATTHPKAVQVYQIRVRKAELVDELAMRNTIESHLSRKLEASIRVRRRVEAALASGAEVLQEWVVSTGEVARLIDELTALRQTRGPLVASS